MFKSIVLCAVVILSSTSSVHAASCWLETLATMQSGSLTPQVDGGFSAPVSGTTFGVSVFGLRTTGWGQVYAGPTWSPNDHWQLGVSAGIEQARGTWRTAGSLGVNTGPVNSFSILEKGASGTWYKTTTTFAVSGHVRLGLLGQTSVGWGPYGEVVPCPHTMFWVAITTAQGATSGLVALQVTSW